MVRDADVHDSGGIDRRGLLKAVGGTAVAAALAGETPPNRIDPDTEWL